MKKNSTEVIENHSIKKVVFFCFIVCSLIIISLLARFFVIWKESRFDGKNKFTLEIIENDSRATIFSFNPEAKSIASITLTGKRKMRPSKILGVFTDGSIDIKSAFVLKEEKAKSFFSDIFYHQNSIKKNITSIDLARLYLLTKTVLEKDIYYETFLVSTDTSSFDKTALQFFIDPKIVDEQKDIEIVNGTGINGVGKRLERIIKNSGGNVIAVSNSRDIVKHSKVFYFDKESYTEEKYSSLLKYQKEKMQSREISDIKILIGLDGIRDDIF